MSSDIPPSHIFSFEQGSPSRQPASNPDDINMVDDLGDADFTDDHGLVDIEAFKALEASHNALQTQCHNMNTNLTKLTYMLAKFMHDYTIMPSTGAPVHGTVPAGEATPTRAVVHTTKADVH